MFKTVLLIVLSFFAVIGFIEFILSFLETISTSKYECIDELAITVALSGSIKNVTFLLNTLLLQAERLNYKNTIAKVVVKDVGLDEDTYLEICEFCMENNNIVVEK